MVAVILEVAEFILNPTRSGVQRVIREIIANWPSDVPIRFARYDRVADALVGVSDRLLRRALAFHPDGERSRHLSLLDESGTPEDRADRPLRLGENDTILVPEVFYDAARVGFYRRLMESDGPTPHFIVYDFVPWLKPASIRLGVSTSSVIMPYLLLVLQADHRCFISESVRVEFVKRIARGRIDDGGPVIVLGSDGIKIERQIYSSDRNEFVCLGTLDGKKGQDIVLEAFLKLPEARRGKLTFLGKIHPNPAPWMRNLLNCDDPGVEIVNSPSEQVICERFRRAKGSVFVSTNEGFGLPAVESLHCGIPVVASAGLPSLSHLPHHGQIRLPDVTVDTVATALTHMMSDGEMERLWAGASRLDLPTWKDYAASIAAWLIRDKGRKRERAN